MAQRIQSAEGANTAALASAERHSPFLRLLIARRPDLVALLVQGDVAAALELALSPGEEVAAIMLRRQRHALALVLAIGDLAGVLPLEG